MLNADTLVYSNPLLNTYTINTDTLYSVNQPYMLNADTLVYSNPLLNTYIIHTYRYTLLS